MPCGACSQRQLKHLCAYPSNTIRSVDVEQKSRTLHDRIDKLETLVIDLMRSTSEIHNDQQSSVPPRSPDALSTTTHVEPTNSPLTHDNSQMHLSSTGNSYVSSSHWNAILHSIGELKEHLEIEEQKGDVSDPLDSDWAGPQLLYGCLKMPTRVEILASIPPRPIMDRLVSGYFTSFEMHPGKPVLRQSVRNPAESIQPFCIVCNS